MNDVLLESIALLTSRQVHHADASKHEEELANNGK